MLSARIALPILLLFGLLACHPALAGDSDDGLPPAVAGFQPGTGPGLLAEGAAEVGADWVEIPDAAETLRAYVAWPAGKGPFPVVLVVQEWWGLNGWLMAQTRKLASMGYVAVAVDLYRGRVASDADTAHQLMRGLDPDRGVGYLRAAFNWVHGQSWAKSGRIGAIGWCMGGGYAASLAVVEPRLKAVVVNYGVLPTEPKRIRKIKAAMLGNFGGLDKGIALEDVRAFKRTLEKRGGRMELHEWPASGHAFMNETNPNHNVADSLNAWHYIGQFLSRHLQANQ